MQQYYLLEKIKGIADIDTLEPKLHKSQNW